MSNWAIVEHMDGTVFARKLLYLLLSGPVAEKLGIIKHKAGLQQQKNH